ncbi:hypothetical protein [Syntrophomonas palmitatica]|uniref:hypothetical protein n=1 Tax=Syntrophomonas palmitatica TaxID=402877 RepID=UPI0006D157E9|nr:hypothetical protein [Syntrophomonas palmitatica]
MKRYDVSEKSWYPSSWVWLALLFLAGLLVWRTVSSLYAAAIAAAGLIIMIFTNQRGKKRVGDYIELNDKGMVFCESGQHHCIAFSEIKTIKKTGITGDPAYMIETTVGNKKRLQPDDYENGAELRDELEKCFAAHNCRL